MYIDIDGKLLELPAHLEAKLAGDVFALIANGLYPTIPSTARQLMKVYARKKLLEMELALNAAGHDGKKIRPPVGTDAVLHYLRIQFYSGLKGIHDAILLIDTENGEGNAIADVAFSVPEENHSEGGRPLLTGGNVGQRQDVGDESPGQASGDALPDAPALHL